MGRYYDDELYHHGIKGQRWGIRRFQNKDGSYTSAGKSHRKTSDSSKNQNGTKKRGLSDRQKTALKVGAVAVGVTLAAYGGYKANKWVNKQNLLVAATAGARAGERFREDIRPKTPFGPGSIGTSNMIVGNNFAAKAGGEVGARVSENVYNSTKGVKRLTNALKAKSITKGKRHIDEFFDYDKEVRRVMKEHAVLTGGQSQLAKLTRDTLNRGGNYKQEWRYW